jgi:hypothetical protein
VGLISARPNDTALDPTVPRRNVRNSNDTGSNIDVHARNVRTPNENRGDHGVHARNARTPNENRGDHGVHARNVRASQRREPTVDADLRLGAIAQSQTHTHVSRLGPPAHVRYRVAHSRQARNSITSNRAAARRASDAGSPRRAWTGGLLSPSAEEAGAGATSPVIGVGRRAPARRSHAAKAGRA